MKVCLKFLVFLLTLSCGANSLKQYEKEDVAEDATIELEKQNPDKAIELLEEALVDDPTNRIFLSLLSAAYAQKHELDLLDLALNIATNSDSNSGSDSEQSELSRMWPFLPDASDENLEGVNTAVTLLQQIGAANRNEADNFKLALLSTASVSLRLKSFDLDGDGKLSLAELLRMDVDDADAIVNGLLGAASAILGSGDQGENSGEAAAEINKIQSELNDSAGDSNQEKIQNYFQANQT